MKIFEITFFGFTVAPTYYGLMYVLGFLYGIWAIKKLLTYSQKERDALLLYVFLGVIFGGRLGYMFFYGYEGLLESPVSLFYIWEGGMSFHGGLIGVIVSAYIFAKNNKKSFFELIDALALIVPVGLFFGRVGNYLNKELLGFPYEGFLAVQTNTGSYFPSPLVEAFLEGVIIFILLNYVHKQSFNGKIGALFLIYYGVFRTFVEICIRTPDPHIGYYFGFLTQGSLLSIPMVILGLWLFFSFKISK